MSAPKISFNEFAKEAAIVIFMLTVLIALDEIINLLRRPTRVIIDMGNLPETGDIIDIAPTAKTEEAIVN